jgi:hypothetical protein
MRSVLVILQAARRSAWPTSRVISSSDVMTQRDGEHVPRRAPERGASLMCRVATRLCALPVDAVIEIMRPLPRFELVERTAS